MHARFALALSGTLLGAASAFATNLTGTDWSVDYGSVRVLRLNPMIVGGGISGDRIMIDMHRESDNVKGTLSISCTTDEYSLWTAESLLLVTTQPLSEWPLAAQLAANYCTQIDHLPEAGKLTPLDI